MNTVSFPRLGLEFHIRPEAFYIGSKPIYLYAIFIMAGFLLGVLFAALSARKRGVSADNVLDVAIYGLAAGIIGARIYYVIFAWDEFRGDILSVFKIWEGGLAIYGGLAGAVIAALIYCRIKKISFLAIADICAPSLLIGQAIGRFGNFVNCEVYGRETASLFGMSINGAAPVHPLFLYEAAWNVLGLILILIFRDKKRADGQVFFAYTAWYSAGRLVLEGMRDTSYILYLIPGKLGISQAVSALLLVFSVGAMVFLAKRGKKPDASQKGQEL